MSVDPADDHHPNPDDEIPRQGFLSTLPKQSLYRVVLLLAMLAGILYLRQRTGSIAGCMADAFRVSPPEDPTRSSAPIKARLVVPTDLPEKFR